MSKKEKEEAKKNRIDNYTIQKEELREQGYTEAIGTISILKANLMAFITAGPFSVLVIAIYISVWGNLNVLFYGSDETILWIALILSVPIHEFLHGLSWHFFCDNKWKSIYFGVMWRLLTPYCYCNESLKFKSYIIGCLMPLIVLGFSISLIGIVFGNSLLLCVGAFNILFAGGDTTIAFMLLKYRKQNCKILDHPTDCGFIAFVK